MIYREGDLTMRPFIEVDLPYYTKWCNDPEVTKYCAEGRFPFSVTSFMNEVLAGRYIVWTLEVGDTPIGFTLYRNLDMINRSGEGDIMIGEPDLWNEGYGTLVGIWGVSHGFDKLNLHRVYCHCSSKNIAAIRANEGRGARREGTYKDAMWINGEWTDRICFAITKPEWDALRRQG